MAIDNSSVSILSTKDAGPVSSGFAKTEERWLCTDLDGTFLDGPASARTRLYQLVRQAPDLRLVFVTGRGIESVLPVLGDPTVPTPDFVVADVGATVVRAPSLEALQPLQAELAGSWPGRHSVEECLGDLPGLQPQGVPQERRCSFLLRDPAMVPRIRKLVAPLACDVLYSAGRYLDILPAGVNKGSTLLRLLDLLSADPAKVLVAGDTLNDLALFETGLPGVVVGNAEAELLLATRDRDEVLHATGHGAEGILEAITADAPAAVTKRASETVFGDAELVIVYHRLPFDEVHQAGHVQRRRPRSPNGIIPTLEGFFSQGHRGSWVAWSRQPSREPDGFEPRVRVDAEAFPNLWASRIPLTKRDVTVFYKEFSKEALWPIIFSFLGQANFRRDHWNHFVEVNRLFAERAATEAAPGAVVWVHDYNLWMVPAFLRPLRPDVRIAFFHHTAFPPPDVFNVLPWRREIVGSLMQCDHVGFHIPRYAENFAEVLRAHAPVKTLERTTCTPRFLSYGCALGLGEMTSTVEVNGREIRLSANPVGIDVERIAGIVARPGVQRRIRKLQEELGDRHCILSIERLDYVKGPLEKLQAYERLLEDHPDLHGRIVLINVCTPPADGMTVYKSVRLKVDEAIGRINGRFARVDWTPVRYFFRSLPFDEVLAYYAVSDVAWITPLRDGLNLVAKEYVAAKAAHGSPGTLVLSEFAGAAVELHDAIRANPYDVADMADVLYRALTIDPGEREGRMRRLVEVVSRYDHRAWSRTFLAEAAPDLT